MRVSDDYLSCVCAVAESKAIPTNADEIALDLRDLRQAAREVVESWGKNPNHVDWHLYMQIAIESLRAQLGQGREEGKTKCIECGGTGETIRSEWPFPGDFKDTCPNCNGTGTPADPGEEGK